MLAATTLRPSESRALQPLHDIGEILPPSPFIAQSQSKLGITALLWQATMRHDLSSTPAFRGAPGLDVAQEITLRVIVEFPGWQFYQLGTAVLIGGHVTSPPNTYSKIQFAVSEAHR
jgi:hypothetical protein